jgi:glycyl-tRNA synthetase
MAHYAADCWDAELETSYGWIECVGCADRSAYDLEAHSRGTNTKLVATIAHPEPLRTVKTTVIPDKKKLGPAFRKDAGAIVAYFANLSSEEAAAFKVKLDADGSVAVTIDGKEFAVPTAVIADVKTETKVEHVRAFTPSVIEPSFGIGRILYCLLEHVYDWRKEPEGATPKEQGKGGKKGGKEEESEQKRGFLKLPPIMAPVKCSLLPLQADAAFAGPIAALKHQLEENGVSNRVDDSGASIGKRYVTRHASRSTCPTHVPATCQPLRNASRSTVAQCGARSSLIRQQTPTLTS